MRRQDAEHALPGINLPRQVLVVDDDPFVSSVIEGVLSAAGVPDIKICLSGSTAVTVVGAFRPELILLDFMMPEMNGRATWQALGACLSPMPPVIFLTARDDADIKAEVAEMRAAGLITKPFNPTSLAEDIARILGRQDAKIKQPAVKQPAAKVRRLAAVGEAFHRSLEGTADRIEIAWNDVRTHGWSREAAETALVEAHSLAGAAGLFGRHALGTAASDAERLLLNTLKLGHAPDSIGMQHLTAAVTALVAVCRASRE